MRNIIESPQPTEAQAKAWEIVLDNLHSAIYLVAESRGGEDFLRELEEQELIAGESYRPLDSLKLLSARYEGSAEEVIDKMKDLGREQREKGLGAAAAASAMSSGAGTIACGWAQYDIAGEVTLIRMVDNRGRNL